MHGMYVRNGERTGKKEERGKGKNGGEVEEMGGGAVETRPGRGGGWGREVEEKK